MPDTEFAFQAGHPCLDLVATLRRRRGDQQIDRLPDADAARRWLDQSGLGAQTLDAVEFTALLALREAVHRLLEFQAGSAAAESVRDAVDCVNELAREPIPAPQLRADGTELTIGVARVTARTTLALLARDAIDLLTGPDAALLHRCEESTCGTYFLEPTSGLRRWCSSKTCGNRARVAAHRNKNRR